MLPTSLVRSVILTPCGPANGVGAYASRIRPSWSGSCACTSSSAWPTTSARASPSGVPSARKASMTRASSYVSESVKSSRPRRPPVKLWTSRGVDPVAYRSIIRSRNRYAEETLGSSVGVPARGAPAASCGARGDDAVVGREREDHHHHHHRHRHRHRHRHGAPRPQPPDPGRGHRATIAKRSGRSPHAGGSVVRCPSFTAGSSSPTPHPRTANASSGWPTSVTPGSIRS